MSATDPRRVYILRVTSHILSLNLTEEKLPNIEALSNFCDGNASLLVICRTDQRGHVDVSNELRTEVPALFRAIIYKIRGSCPLSTVDYKSEINIITAHKSIEEAFNSSIHQVFSNSTDERMNAKIRSLLDKSAPELDYDGDKLSARDNARIGPEMNIETELKYWEKRAALGTDTGGFSNILKPLREKLFKLESSDYEIYDLFGFSEVAEECVESLWNSADASYSQQRMTQLLQAISLRLCTLIQTRLKQFGDRMWHSDVETLESLINSLTLLKNWNDTTRQLTTSNWTSGVMTNEWRGGEFKLNTQFHDFYQLLKKIHAIKTFPNEVGYLSGNEEHIVEATTVIKSNLSDFNAFNSVKKSKRAFLAVEQSFDEIVERFIPQLRSHFQSSSEHAAITIIEDIDRYENFLRRENVCKALRSERETLVTRLLDYLNKSEQKLQSSEFYYGINVGKFLTEITAKITFLRQNIITVEKIRKSATILCSDLPYKDELMERSTAYLTNLSAAEHDLFNEWCRETIGYANPNAENSLALQTTGRLMRLEHERGRLSVSYSDRLVRLLAEIRQLQALDFQIPSKILQCAQTGDKFYEYGIVLKQVAHFYNTIEQQMLPCQQAMMLDEALAFERLIIPPAAMSAPRSAPPAAINVTWDDPDRLKNYIEKLKDAAFKLTSHNSAHAEIDQLVAEMMEINMLRDEEKWAEKLLAIRHKFADEERQVGAKSNVHAWATHWDRQLYKVLHVQFRSGLETLAEQMPPIHAQIIVRDDSIQFRPPLEEIRSHYYKELNKFLLIPQKFTGIYNDKQNTEMFATMVSQNTKHFHALYEDSAEIFRKLETLANQFENWTSLCSANFESLIEQKFQRAADWEDQFRHIKQKRRALENIHSQIDIGCLRVSTNALKATVDETLKRLYDALVWTLKNSAATQLQDVERELNQGIDSLAHLPQNLDEIAEANQSSIALAHKIFKFREQIQNIEEKHEVLRGLQSSFNNMSNATANLTAVRQQFNRFESLLDGYEYVMKEQVEILRQNVSDRITRLSQEAEKLFSLWNQFKPRSDALFGGGEGPPAAAGSGGGGERLAMVRAVEFVREKRRQFAQLADQRTKIGADCEQMELDSPTFPVLDEMQKDLDEFESNYLLYDDFSDELQKLADQEWILFRNKTYLFDEFLQGWLEKLNGMGSAKTPVSIRLEKDIEYMKNFAGCLKYCRGETLNADHWIEMFRLLGLRRGTTLEALRFGDLLAVQEAVLRGADRLRELNSRAQGELAIREAIQELELWAAQSEFLLTDYKLSNGNAIKIVKDWKGVIVQVKDNQALLQSLRNLPYHQQFADRTAIWERRIGDLDASLQLLNEIQRRWIYLEPIFGRGALPTVAARFNRVDVEMRVILGDITKDPRIVSLSNRTALRNTLEQIADQLSRCQRALNEFLEDKRRAFPRFYFLGDDDLLEILGQSTNPAVIQTHLKKLFQGIDKVVFDARMEQICGVVSADGERVELARAVRVVALVERWLHDLTAEMRHTLQRLFAECLRADALNLHKYPAQILCLTEQVRFCSDVERCLRAGGMTVGRSLVAYESQLRSQLEDLASSSSSGSNEKCILRLKRKSLILELIHRIDVVGQLRAAGATTVGCWAWQKQLRFYANAEHTVTARQAGAELAYTFEYQGNVAPLVQTPLTDRCYLTLTQALAMGLGGNPYGPAGTGKTESVKALARRLGRQVLVFNCDEAIDVPAIGRIFIGLVQCGAWGCFDEFNRLEKSVLSAVSGQIQTIQDAIRSGASECQLDEFPPVKVDTNAALFVTMNPAGKAYGGRQHLPDNLKQLCRPVPMSVPDNEQIADILLYADGFRHPKVLARKLVTAFNLSRDMLSHQHHYDWGLRAIKTVLRTCGDALAKARPAEKTEPRKGTSSDPNQELDRELSIVLHAVRLNTASKLTFADSRRFRHLLADIFPDTRQSAGHAEEELIKCIGKAADEMGIIISERQRDKILQLHEQLRQRLGVVIVGSSGVGKSTIWRVLARTLAPAGGDICVARLNAKCMPRWRLLGAMDADTGEWTDGVLTSVARRLAREIDPDQPAWVVFDGDVDPEWIESLNSVLDDNKLLTIPSGERIQFGDNINFIFETCDLSHASPATVSRMGMIFISDEELDVFDLIDGCFAGASDGPPANECAEWTATALRFALANPNRELFVGRPALLKNVASLIRNVKTRNQFLVGLYRGLLPYTSAEKRKALALQVIFAGMPTVAALGGAGNVPPQIYCDERTDSLAIYVDEIHDYGSASADEWPLVLTAKTQAARDTIMAWLSPANEPFLVVGEDGCGKEQLLRHCFAVNASHATVATIHCNAQTEAVHLEHLLYEHCVQASDASGGRVLRPRNAAGSLIIYAKSPNLIRPDRYGTSSFVALLEQILTYGGFYDARLEWIGVKNVKFVLSVSDIARAERFVLPSRLLSRLRMLVVERPDAQELRAIYGAHLRAIVAASDKSVATDALASQMVDVFERVRRTFVARHSHYAFTVLDLTRWVRALTRHNAVNGESSRLATVYEARKIFRDRLVDVAHRHQFDEIVAEIFGIKPAAYDDIVFATNGTPLTAANIGVARSLTCQPRRDYVQRLAKIITRYESEAADFNLPLAVDVVDVCVAIERIITKPGGSALLAVRSGGGHAAIARLAAYAQGLRVVAPAALPLKQFLGQLKEVMYNAGCQNEKLVFLVEEHQLAYGNDATVSDGILQCLNAVIAAGAMPGLYTGQDWEQIAGALREEQSTGGGGRDVREYFAQKVMENLHVVLVLDVAERNFDERLAANPSLYKHCTVIWRDGWERSALVEIAELSLQKSDKFESTNARRLAEHFADVFVGGFVDRAPSPAKFLALLDTFAATKTWKRAGGEARLSRLRAGVDKLTEARNAVARLQKRAAKKSRILAEKQAEADRALAEITKSMTGASEQKENMEQLRTVTEAENAKIEAQKRVIEAQLTNVEPLLTEAREAVGSIRTESLSEIRSLRAPPDAIRDILQAVLLFMGILDVSWEAMRRFLAKTGVKEEIINFDARQITSETARRVQKLVTTKSASFDPKNAKRASAAAAPLAAWVNANLQYANILERIAPLENVRVELTRNLESAQAEMSNLSAGLSSLDQRVAQLKNNFEDLVKDATQIKIDLGREEATIIVAGTLVDRLQGEFDRWQSQIKLLEEEVNKMDACCLLSAATVALLGAASEESRAAALAAWRAICLPVSDRFRPTAFLANEVEQMEWKERANNAGLTWTDALAESLAILFNSRQPALAVDPSGRIANLLALQFGDNAQILKATQSDLVTQVEMGVRFGKTLIIVDCDEAPGGIDPALVPLLRRDYFSQGGRGVRTVVQLGAKSVDLDERFRLYLCARDEHVRLPEFIQSAVNTVTFATTKSALSSQILSLAMGIAKPELEQRSVALGFETAAMRARLLASEQQLLTDLANAEGSILDNAELLASLNASKADAERIHTALDESQIVRQEIDNQRAFYATFAQRCAQLYFAISDLTTINPLYNFGVDVLLRLFRAVFAVHVDPSRERDSSSGPALDIVYGELRRRLFDFVSRTVFAVDRLTFAMRYIHATQSATIQPDEWEFFLGNEIDSNVDAANPKDYDRGALPSDETERQTRITRFKACLPRLQNALDLDFDSAANSRLSGFQRLLVVQTLRPNRFHAVMRQFAAAALSVPSVDESLLDWCALCDELEADGVSQPVLITVGAGAADPTAELAELCARRRRGATFRHIAMGGGGRAIDTAIEALGRCVEAGDWLCLNNVHLIGASDLQKIQQISSTSKPASGFQLWLIISAADATAGNGALMAMFVRECVKIAYETPPSLRDNVGRSLTLWLTDGGSSGGQRARAVFTLCWVHALLQERRTFIPEGWLKYYEFCGSDLRAARHTLERLLRESPSSPDWEAFRGLLLHTVYGGRVESSLDERILAAYLLRFFADGLSSSDGEWTLPLAGRRVPALVSLNDYTCWLASGEDSSDNLPAALGLAPNVNVSWALAQSAEAIAKLRRLAAVGPATNPRADVLSQAADALARPLAPVFSLWRRLNQSCPEILTPPPAVDETTSENLDDPLVEALRLERAFGLKVARLIHVSLSSLNRVCRGQIAPTAQMTADAQALVAQQVPDEWRTVWPAPNALHVDDYLEALAHKAQRIANAAADRAETSAQFFARGGGGSSNADASIFFRPTLLLNAFRQYAARKMGVEIDTISMRFVWENGGRPPDSATPTLTVTGLYIQGARLLGSAEPRLSVVDSQAAAFSTAPSLTVYWTADVPKNAVDTLVDVPLFADRRRETFVASVGVPCAAGEQNDWTLAGVALFWP